MKKLFIILGGFCLTAFAEQTLLNDFLTNAKTMKANFTQTIVMGKKSRVTNGTMEISRPNKFRWTYIEDKQLIVSDAKKVYIYDQPLQQVTVKKLDSSIDKSPAAVLAGANNIQNLYKVSMATTDNNDGLKWIKIEPKQATENNGFKIVLMGFDKKKNLAAMQFIDAFGNKSMLTFNDLHTGMPISDDEFNFKVPKGVDVVEQ